MSNEQFSCDGCDKPGYYGVCTDCKMPEHTVEERNHNVRQPTHNLYNVSGGMWA